MFLIILNNMHTFGKNNNQQQEYIDDLLIENSNNEVFKIHVTLEKLRISICGNF